MKIQDTGDNHCVNVTEENHLMVCLCGKTCDNHLSLRGELGQIAGMGLLLFYRDKDGKVKSIEELLGGDDG